MERTDDLQYKGLKLIQDDELFCFGCDAVELANFVTGGKTDLMCDIGCGTGIIPVLVNAKRGMKAVGVEIGGAEAKLAKRNVEMNDMSGAVEIVCARIQDYAADIANVGRFSVVTCNPPYRKVGSGEMQKNPAVAAARHELTLTLEEAVSCAARLLKSGGKFFTVCQTQRLAETMSLCIRYRLAPKILQVLRPADNKTPHLFLLKCIKDGAQGLEVLPERNVRAYGM